jgi:hypothetical protein
VAITHIAFRVLDNKEYRALDFRHLPVHAVEAEAVLTRAEDQCPEISLGPCGKMPAQLFPVLVAQYLRCAHKIRNYYLRVQGYVAISVQCPPQLLAHRQYLQSRMAVFSKSTIRRIHITIIPYDHSSRFKSFILLYSFSYRAACRLLYRIALVRQNMK